MHRIICTTLLVETSPQAIPLGAACIASAIKSDELTKARCAVTLIDFSLEDSSLQALPADAEKAQYMANALAEQKPDAVCFSIYVWNHTLLEATARTLKELLPNVVCIAGGPEVTAAPRAFTVFDYTIAGQGEAAVPLLLSTLFENPAPAPQKKTVHIPGVYSDFSATGTAGSKKTADTAGTLPPVVRASPCNPSALASPYLDGTIDLTRYGGALWELARGCPFKCSYCYESKGEPKIAYFPQERLEKELDLFAKKDIPQVFVLDPTYNANKKRAVDMLHLIAKKTPRTFFYFEARAEFIDRELSHAFSRIPCALQIGLQSADPAVLKNVHRTLDKKLFTRNIGFLNQEGVTFGFDLIYGLPGDSYQGFCRSIDFALSLYPNNLELFCLSVLPGTVLHDEAAAFGMQWEENPPYHVLQTPRFSPRDIARAGRLSRACNIFYNDGRAVPWFNSILFPLQKKASLFLEEFAGFLESGKQKEADSCLSHQDIEKLQCAFVEKCYREQQLSRLLPAALDLIRMHGAISRCTASGEESSVSLSYHPDDIMSEYGLDLPFFAENCRPQACRARVFSGQEGADWRLEEKKKKQARHF